MANEPLLEGGGPTEELVQLASKSIYEGDFTQAHEYLDDAEADGASVALYRLAMKENRPKRIGRAVHQQLESNDDPLVPLIHARLVLMGAIEGNQNNAFDVLRKKSVEAGYASYTLGQYYEGIFGGEQDWQQAELWYRLARDTLNAVAAKERLEEVNRQPVENGTQGTGATVEHAGGQDGNEQMRQAYYQSFTITKNMADGGSIPHKFALAQYYLGDMGAPEVTGVPKDTKKRH
eukprot:gb/GECG01011392.1/.p1 GENE.gb/GECG01011392.1/~~gb/GECG01011392.1/.p1  ORF type:complete len:234 (+),score=33.38 gb/GECG01011392.1/:1-702(+)